MREGSDLRASREREWRRREASGWECEPAVRRARAPAQPGTHRSERQLHVTSARALAEAGPRCHRRRDRHCPLPKTCRARVKTQGEQKGPRASLGDLGGKSCRHGKSVSKYSVNRHRRAANIFGCRAREHKEKEKTRKEKNKKASVITIGEGCPQESRVANICCASVAQQ